MKGELFVHRIDTEESHRRGAGLQSGGVALYTEPIQKGHTNEERLPSWRVCSPLCTEATQKGYTKKEGLPI